MKIDVDYYYTQKFLPTKRHKKIRKRQIKADMNFSNNNRRAIRK